VITYSISVADQAFVTAESTKKTYSLKYTLLLDRLFWGNRMVNRHFHSFTFCLFYFIGASPSTLAFGSPPLHYFISFFTARC